MQIPVTSGPDIQIFQNQIERVDYSKELSDEEIIRISYKTNRKGPTSRIFVEMIQGETVKFLHFAERMKINEKLKALDKKHLKIGAEIKNLVIDNVSNSKLNIKLYESYMNFLLKHPDIKDKKLSKHLEACDNVPKLFHELGFNNTDLMSLIFQYIGEHKCISKCSKFSDTKCSKCKEVRYCNDQCQRKDFTDHQTKCDQYEAARKNNENLQEYLKTWVELYLGTEVKLKFGKFYSAISKLWYNSILNYLHSIMFAKMTHDKMKKDGSIGKISDGLFETIEKDLLLLLGLGVKQYWSNNNNKFSNVPKWLIEAPDKIFQCATVQDFREQSESLFEDGCNNLQKLFNKVTEFQEQLNKTFQPWFFLTNPSIYCTKIGGSYQFIELPKDKWTKMARIKYGLKRSCAM